MRKLAIITGASRGIGKAAAERFIAGNWQVVNLARGRCEVAGVRNYTCDLASSETVTAVISRLDLKGFETVSIIHNAGLLTKDNAATVKEEDFLQAMQVNVWAPQLINRLLIPFLPEGSSLIFVGSTLSEIAAPNLLSYVTSKHALAGVMKSTCLDVAHRRIHTCLICPGFTDTQMLRESVGTDEAMLRAITESMVTLKRLVLPQEIAELIFFASGNPALNGAVLHANLGQK